MVADLFFDFILAGKQCFIPQHFIIQLLLVRPAFESVGIIYTNIVFYPYACLSFSHSQVESMPSDIL
jgi:hypothetical protein